MRIGRLPRLATLLHQVRSRFSGRDRLPDQRRIVPQIFWAALRSVAVSSAVVVGMVLVAQRVGWLEPLELAMFDQWVRLRPPLPTDDRLLIIGITEEDIRQYGWPITDEVLADALTRLQAVNPSVIGLDLYRELPVPPGEPALTAALSAPNLIAITNNAFAIPPPPTVPPRARRVQ